MLKIALGQIEIISGQFEKNFIKIKEAVLKAQEQAVDLIVFPQMAICGTHLGDSFLNPSIIDDILAYNEAICALSDNIGIIFGGIKQESQPLGSETRTNLYKGAFFAYNKVWYKDGFFIQKLRNERYNHDKRYFIDSAQSATYLIEFKKVQLGIAFNHAFNEDEEPINCEYLIALESFPYNYKQELVDLKQIEHYLSTHKINNYVFVNNVGIQNNGKNVLIYEGGSFIYNVNNQSYVWCSDDFKADLKFSTSAPLLKCHREDKLLNALVYGIRKFDEEMFNQKLNWIIGLSGGLDSSVSCALLGLALNKERIYAYNLATSYNSLETRDNASQEASKLGIKLSNGSIEELVDASKEVLINEYQYSNAQVSGLVLENIQARVRGHLLASFAAIHNGVVCNNGNKVEVALGYCTLYGDSIGALGVLGDLCKSDLFTLAHQINHKYGFEVIATRLLPNVSDNDMTWEMPPSAELKDNQYDPMKWFYHDELIAYLTTAPHSVERLMELYLNDELQADSKWGRWIKYYHLDEPLKFINDLEWVLKQIQMSIFKRLQMPPILCLSGGSFGNDYLENQSKVQETASYLRLREQILAKANKR